MAIQLHILNHTGMDFRFTSNTLNDGSLLLEIWRREQQPPKNGIIIGHDNPMQDLGVLQYEEGKKRPV